MNRNLVAASLGAMVLALIAVLFIIAVYFGERWVTTWWPRRSQSTHVGALRPCGQPSV